jgi:hypothetical protein
MDVGKGRYQTAVDLLREGMILPIGPETCFNVRYGKMMVEGGEGRSKCRRCITLHEEKIWGLDPDHVPNLLED